MDLGSAIFHNVTDWVQWAFLSGKVRKEHLLRSGAMELSDTQVFAALVVALLPLAMAVQLGLALYKG
jgi:Photosystem I protein M (PsaM).